MKQLFPFQQYSLLEKLDIFGIAIGIRFNQFKSHKTVFGGITTVVIISIILYQTFKISQYVLSQKNPIVIQQQRYVYQPEMYQFTPKTYNLAIGIQDEQSNHFLDESIYRLRAIQEQSVRVLNEQSGEYELKQIYKEIKMVQCRIEYFQVQSTIDYFEKLPLDQLYCFSMDEQAIAIEGEFSAEKYQAIQFLVELCVGDITCQDPTTVEQRMKNPRLGMYITDVFVDVMMRDQPYQIFGKNIFYPSSYELHKEVRIYLQNNYIETDVGYLTSQIDHDRVISYTDSREFMTIRTTDKELFKAVIAYEKNTEFVYRRSYMKIDQAFSQIGGIFNILLSIGCLLCWPISQLELNRKLLNQAFNIIYNGKKDNQDSSQNERKSMQLQLKDKSISGVMQTQQILMSNSKKEEFEKTAQIKSPSMKPEKNQMKIDKNRMKEQESEKKKKEIEKENYYKSVKRRVNFDVSDQKYSEIDLCTNQSQLYNEQQRQEQFVVGKGTHQISSNSNYTKINQLSAQMNNRNQSKDSKDSKLLQSKQADYTQNNESQSIWNSNEKSQSGKKFISRKSSIGNNDDHLNFMDSNEQKRKQSEQQEEEQQQESQESHHFEYTKSKQKNVNKQQQKNKTKQHTAENPNFVKRLQDQDEKKLKVSFMEYVKNYLSVFRCCQTRKSRLIHQGTSMLYDHIDIFYIINKLIEVEKLKHILLDKNQLNLFEFLPKPMLTLENLDSLEKIDQALFYQSNVHRMAEQDLGYYLIKKKSNFERAREAQISYFEIKRKSQENNPINKKIFQLLKLDNVSINQKSYQNEPEELNINLFDNQIMQNSILNPFGYKVTDNEDVQHFQDYQERNYSKPMTTVRENPLHSGSSSVIEKQLPIHNQSQINQLQQIGGGNPLYHQDNLQQQDISIAINEELVDPNQIQQVVNSYTMERLHKKSEANSCKSLTSQNFIL